MRTKRKSYLLAIVLSTTLFCFTAAFLLLKTDNGQARTDDGVLRVGAATGSIGREKAEKYLVKSVGNYVCVFPPDNMENALYQTEIDIRTMREMDRMSFERGILVHSDKELASLLEDYES